MILRGTLFIFWALVTLSVLRCHLTFPLESLTFWTITTLRTFCHLSIICVIYRLENWVSAKNGVNSWKFSCDDLLCLSTWIIKTRMHWSTYFHFWRWSLILCYCETLVHYRRKLCARCLWSLLKITADFEPRYLGEKKR